MITWLLELIPEKIIRTHHDPEYKYKKVTLETIYKTFVDAFEAKPEDIQAIQLENQQPWDSTTWIQSMMNKIEDNLREIAEMEGNTKYTTPSSSRQLI